MKNYYSDPTGNAAIGSADREFRQLLKLALKLREVKRAGTISPELEKLVRREFSGLYSVLLEDDFLDKVLEAQKSKEE